MMPTKRSIKRAIEALKEDAASEPLEEAGDSEDEHLEIIPDVMCTGPAPTVSAFAQHRGFVVERGEANAAYTPLQTIPSMRAVYTPARWHMPGPTARPAAIQIAWEADRLAAALEAADTPTYEPAPLPDERVSITSGDGWEAVAPADHVVENMVLSRPEAESWGYPVLGPAPDWVGDNFVEVDAEPIPYGERRR